MSAEVEELWKSLRFEAKAYAERGDALDEHGALELVHKLARRLKMTEPLPAHALQFYAAEVLRIIRDIRSKL